MLRQYYNSHIAETTRLAVPIMLSYAGHMIVVVTDAIMVGNYSTTQFAGSVFAHSVFMNIMVFGFGFSAGLTPLIGEAFGANNTAKIAQLLKNSLVVNSLLTVVLTALCFVLVELMDSMNQTPRVVEIAKPYMTILGLSIVPMMVFQTFKQCSDGMLDTKPAMWCTIAADGINIIGNYLLVFGNFGFPELGAKGSAIATLIARFLCAVGLLWYMFRTKRYRTIWTLMKTTVSVELQIVRTIARMSFPTALQSFLEVSGFTIGSIMMGWMGEKALAAHQIVLGMASFTFMVANGFALATNIRISNLLGSKQLSMIRPAGWSGLLLVGIFMSITGLCFVLFRTYIPYLYTSSDTDVITLASTLFIVAGLFQVFDGIQVLMTNALRGLQDVRVPMVLGFFSYWLLSLPIGYICAFILGLREVGIWLGYLAGLFFISVLLVLRFHSKTRQYAL